MKGLFKNFKGDLFGGITAGVVALPLALAFGDQSGLGAIAGLYGAIVLGILAAVFGGTPTQISGPTAPMLMVAIMVASEAGVKGVGIVFAAFLAAGLFQILFGLLKIGKYIKYIPYPVLSGFMTGIGVMIITFQIFPSMGQPSPKTAIDVFAGLAGLISQINWEALTLTASTVAVIYLFPKITKVVPSALIALLAVSAVAVFFAFEVPIIGHIPKGLPELKIGEIFSIEASMIGDVLKFGFILAALGMIDSLLTSLIADNITKSKHQSNRELIGQGIGNIGAALVGGLPGAGATVRTVVNVNNGGRTRLSGVIHGLLLITVLFGLGQYAAFIPKSVLSGILITVGIGIIDKKGLKHLRHMPLSDSIILVTVLLITVFGDLLWAVGVGMVSSCLIFMKKAGDAVEEESSIKPVSEHLGDEKLSPSIYVKHLDGPLFFGFTHRFQELVMDLDDQIETLIIDMDNVPYMDQTGVYALEEVVQNLKEKNKSVYLVGVDGQPREMLEKINIIPGLIPQSHLYQNIQDISL